MMRPLKRRVHEWNIVKKWTRIQEKNCILYSIYERPCESWRRTISPNDELQPERPVRGERANFTGLVLGGIEAKICK